jgi:hypothetical protein
MLGFHERMGGYKWLLFDFCKFKKKMVCKGFFCVKYPKLWLTRPQFCQKWKKKKRKKG